VAKVREVHPILGLQITSTLVNLIHFCSQHIDHATQVEATNLDDLTGIIGGWVKTQSLWAAKYPCRARDAPSRN
jgi:hypothetical protein